MTAMDMVASKQSSDVKLPFIGEPSAQSQVYEFATMPDYRKESIDVTGYPNYQNERAKTRNLYK